MTPTPLHPAACPTCQRPYPLQVANTRPLTDREIDAMSAWWHVRNVKLTAVLIGVAEQRAKNLLASARAKSAVHSNAELVALHLGWVRPYVDLVARDKVRGSES